MVSESRVWKVYYVPNLSSTMSTSTKKQCDKTQRNAAPVYISGLVYTYETEAGACKSRFAPREEKILRVVSTPRLKCSTVHLELRINHIDDRVGE